ncbi:MAG: bifunctional riboflavin kinase/FAD synthetase [Deltaproteobacteria bacterium]|nr:bifunctional riboflavin kinase/FAD synthetase [Deltaproteobacteria bacterium]
MMDLIHGSENIPEILKGAFVTIGNFDGVHLGHRFIFRKLVEEAHHERRPAVAISFDPHPKMVLHPERRPFYLITSLEEKVRLLEGLGIDAFILIPFSLEYARTTAEEFVRGTLWEKLRIRRILIGHDYTFGRGREGDEAFLTEAGRRLGFEVEVMNAFCVGDTVISSTKIREALLTGEVRFAATLLGRPYNLSGRVISGNRRGVRLGFPTANIIPDKELVPARGVYAVRVLREGKRHDGILNIGFNPTFADGKRSVEVHIFDFHEDIYGASIEILFVERIRDEIRFESPEKLIAQIDRDIARAREILESEK